MSGLTRKLAFLYGTQQDAFEDLCDTLIAEADYFEMSLEEQGKFHDWAMANADQFVVDNTYVDWVGMLDDWINETVGI